MIERKPKVLKPGMKTYRVALYEVRDRLHAQLLDVLEFDAKSTKNIFRTLDRRLSKQAAGAEEQETRP